MTGLREQLRQRTLLAPEEVQRRLAAATAAWAGAPRGRAVAPQRAPGGRFVACEGAADGWLSLPVVVAGEIRPDGAGACVTAVIRPHAAAVAPYALTALVLSGPSFARGLPLFGLLWLALVAAVGVFNLAGRLAERAPALRALVADACGAPSPGPGAAPRAG